MAPKTILVVDDTEDLRALTSRILTVAGFDVLEADSGAAALSLASRRPDLIVLDVHMPDMDGFEVCQRLKAAPATAAIPVLYLSAAYREEHHRIRGLETGGAAYLTRPIESDDLVATVRALLRLRQAEGEIAASPERYRHLFDRANDGVWAADPSGSITYVNPRLAAMLAFEPAEIIGRAFTDFVDPAERAPVQAILERQRRGITGLHEFRCWRKDATEMWAIVSAIPLADDGGDVRGTLGVVIDVTERKRAEEALLRLASIIESSDDAIIGKTLDGIILSWNHAAERMYGYAVTEAIGRSISIIVPPDRHRELADLLASLRRGESVSRLETVRRRKDGKTLSVSLTASPIQDTAGRIIGASTIARDVSGLKRAEAVEREAAALASVASLAAAAAHEINNPLTVIVGTVELLLKRGLDPDTAARVERAVAAAFEIQEIVRRMNRITRVELFDKQPNLPDMLDLFSSSGGAG